MIILKEEQHTFSSSFYCFGVSSSTCLSFPCVSFSFYLVSSVLFFSRWPWPDQDFFIEFLHEYALINLQFYFYRIKTK
jgi:hypothetical protein